MRDTLIDKLLAHLRQMSPHVGARTTATLLQEAVDALVAANARAEDLKVELKIQDDANDILTRRLRPVAEQVREARRDAAECRYWRNVNQLIMTRKDPVDGLSHADRLAEIRQSISLPIDLEKIVAPQEQQVADLPKSRGVVPASATPIKDEP